MTEETTTPVDDGPTEIILDPSPPEAVESVTNEEPAEEEAAAEPEGEGEKEGDEEAPLPDEKEKGKKGAQARFDELTRRLHEAERRAARLEAAAAKSHPAEGAPARPTSDQFDDYGDYVEALTDWKVGQNANKQATTEAEEAAKDVSDQRGHLWGAKIEAAKTLMPDFDTVMEKADAPTAPHVASAIMDAERGPELLYYLASNPEVVAKLNNMGSTRAAIELGRIEATLEAPAKPEPPRDTTTTKAPTPITPVTPGQTTTKDPSKMNMDEYVAYRKAQGIR